MAAQRTTFGKIQRDRAKREKQELKRQRKAEARAEQEEAATAPAVPVGADAEGELTAVQLLEAVEALHTAFENDEIDFETFEEQKAALMARISV